jgi:hypothetical protein
MFDSSAALDTLLRIEQLLINQLEVLICIKEKIMSTTPVSQATFDAALATLNTTLSSLLSVGTSIGTGLVNLEAALLAAQQNPGTTDLSGELATVQNMQAELGTALTDAQAVLAGIPAAEQPAPVASAEVKKG